MTLSANTTDYVTRGWILRAVGTVGLGAGWRHGQAAGAGGIDGISRVTGVAGVVAPVTRVWSLQVKWSNGTAIC